jgi:type IV pilus assembly protein PilO
MNIAQLNELDLSNVGSWPNPIKAVSILLVCLVVLGLGYWFDTRHQIEQLGTVELEEARLRQVLLTKQAKAVNLEAYKQQSEEMKKTFGTMVRQLPNRTEVAELLVDVSQTGLANGLEFELFRPTAENPQEFYAELPINLRVVGHFHEFGNFVSSLAALPRIVTLHDIQISRRGEDQNAEADDNALLVMNATAKTYRYLDEEEMSPEENAK